MALHNVLRRELDAQVAGLPSALPHTVAVLILAVIELDEAVRQLEQRLAAPEWRDRR